ncbi:MAG: ABC transporter substrate-binding protein, partial [Actinomycetota bacterium]|nr:ABC transporter substrate-binding protein [Actinomycetota bacterium]
MTWSLDRRRLLKAGTASLSAFAVGACSDLSGLDPKLEEVTTPTPGEATRGGVLRYGLSSDPSNFEPHVSTGSASDTVRQLVYNGLLQYDGDGDIVTDLAAEHGWADPTTYRVKLRSGVVFHDGSPMTADDVVFSFRRILDP